jgi:hypothetical protein
MGKLGKRKRQRQQEQLLQQAALAAELPVGQGHIQDAAGSDAEDSGSGVPSSTAQDALDLISPADLATTIRVVTALGSDLATFRARMYKPLRAALHPIVEEHMKNYDGPKGRKRGRAAEVLADGGSSLTAEQKLKQRDLELMNSRQLRAARLKKLEQMGLEGQAEAEGRELAWRVPDGVALENGGHDEFGGGSLFLADAGGESAGAAEEDGSGTDKWERRLGSCMLPADQDQVIESATLHNPISCYTCECSTPA